MGTIYFCEQGASGFGDRLRGIALALHLAEKQGASVIEYNETTAMESKERRLKAFPWRVTDLIQIEGVDFRYSELPFPEGENIVFHNSAISPKLMREGFRHFHRVLPRDPAVLRAVARMGVGQDMVGFHLRQTDTMHLNKIDDADAYDALALKRIKNRMRHLKLNAIFLAADNAEGRCKWRSILEADGYVVCCYDNVEFDTTQLRQTGVVAMLIDFFALSACREIVRYVPSEFSRFAAWRAGYYMRYRELSVRPVSFLKRVRKWVRRIC